MENSERFLYTPEQTKEIAAFRAELNHMAFFAVFNVHEDHWEVYSVRSGKLIQVQQDDCPKADDIEWTDLWIS